MNTTVHAAPVQTEGSAVRRSFQQKLDELLKASILLAPVIGTVLVMSVHYAS